MRNRITWKEKYLLALSEELTLKEIMLLRDCGMPKARSIRQDAIEYCLINNIQTEMKKIPTEAVFSVTGCDLNYYYVDLLDYSTRYKNVILSLFKSLFKYARKYYKLKNDPTYVIEPFKSSFEEKMKQKEKELSRVWQVDEFNQFIKYVNNDTYEAFFITLFYTGMRLGEIQALTWKDFKNGELQIVKSVTRKAQGKSYAIKEPKSTSSIRNIQVGKNLEMYLNKYKEKQSKIAGFNEDWFMFGNLKPLAKTTITREKDRAIKEAGVKRISIHDFRHSHASNLIANGINIVAVSKRLGHSSVEMTLRVYTHLIKTTEDQLLSYIDESSQNLLTK